MRPAKSFWQDVSWQAAGNGIAQLIGIGGLPILTRIYTPDDFALQSLFLQVVMLLTGVMTWRYEYLLPLPKSDQDAKTMLALIIVLAIGSVAILTPPAIHYSHYISQLLGNPALARWIAVLPLTAALISCALAVQHFVQRDQNYKTSGLSEISSKVGYVGSGLMGNLLGGPTGLVCATAVAATAKLLHLLFSAAPAVTAQLRTMRRWRRFYDRMRTVVVSYSRLAGSLVGSHFLATITTAVPIFFISQEYGGQTLGQYSLVLATIFLPAGLIGSAIGQVYYQRAAQEWAQGRSFQALWRSTTTRLMAFGLPTYVVIGLLSKSLYPVIFGNAWYGAGNYAALLSVAAFCSFISSPMDRTCLVVGAWRYPVVWHFSRATTTVFVAVLAHLLHWSFELFLIGLIFQMSLHYLADMVASYIFAARQPIVLES